ncbi:hypothetical protein NECAME_15460 [Necator americanus]|uniref:Transporter, major facilitator family protein n=1 Tax=Necator americanus TaxID=51031 RepID=W2SHW1_NECAM|nr:hypothetical protein NECAME_15460 [Necator americanus]ETN69185.1 hypothetical protein NECAME_15460 [Necator americanus]
MNKAWWNEFLCILCLGVATMCLMTGYDTQSFIVESILHSVHMREPSSMDKHAGYYGQSMLYAAYTLSTLFAPWACYQIGSKWTLFAGSALFTVYQAGFFMLNSYYYYVSQALMGIGFAMYYCGQGLYMSEHSTRASIARNSTLVSAIGNCSMLVGGVVMFIIFYIREQNKGANEMPSAIDTPIYRNFLNNEIYIIYGVLLTFSLVSNAIFAGISTKKIDGCEKLENIDKSTFRTQLANIIDTAREPRMILLSSFFAFYGFSVSYWLGSYPTTFAFSKALSKNVYLPAYYSFMVGLGSVTVGFYIAIFDKWFPNFGLIPTMVTEILLSVLMYFLTIASTANLSTIQTTDDMSMWITPSVTVCCILGLLNGAIDCCSCTMRALICTIAVPRKRLQAYSLAKLYQSAASCAAYFLSPHLTVRSWMMVLAGIQVFSSVGFIIVSKQILKEELIQKEGRRTCSQNKIRPAV